MSNALLAGVSALPGWNLSLLLLLAKATIILIAALGVTMAMQRASAGARHLVWLVTLGTLLLIPALTAWGPLRVKVLPASAAAVEQNVVGTPNPVPSPKPAPRIEQSAPIADANVGASLPPTRESTSPSASAGLLDRLANMSGISMLIAAWLIVVVAIGASLAWASLAVRRIVKHATPLDTADWTTPMWEVADRMGLDEVPRLLRSNDAKMPFACGITAPTIVLPADSDNWTLDRRRAVLLHELAHVRRHDLLGHTLGRLVCAVYWFHPLVWTAAKQLRNESERACDDLALSCGTRATDYAEHLLDIVTSVRRDATPSVALAMARRKEFEGRMLAILDPELRHSTPSRRQSAVLIATLALVALTVGATAPVARDAIAATPSVAERAGRADSVVGIPKDEPQQTQVGVKSYPDSGIRGVTKSLMRVDTNTSTTMSVSTHESTSQSTFEKLVEKGVDAGVNVGLNAAAQAIGNLNVSASVSSAAGLRAIIQSKAKGDTDDRPVLLAKVLRTDTSATLRRIAAWGLSEYAEETVASAALANAVRRDASEGVREMAAWALGNGNEGRNDVIPALEAALKGDASDKVRASAAWALGNIGEDAGVDGLIAALSDKNAGVRTRSIWAIGNISPKSAPKALVAMLKDEDIRVRKVTAWALYNIEDASAAPALEAALKVEQDKDAQLDYIRALAAMGDKSVDAIRGLLESPDQRIKTMAVRALAGGHASGPWPWPWPEPRPYP